MVYCYDCIAVDDRLNEKVVLYRGFSLCLKQLREFQIWERRERAKMYDDFKKKVKLSAMNEFT